jgi:acyl-CoA thioesterase I
MKIKFSYFCCALIFIISSCAPYYKTNNQKNNYAIADKSTYLQDVKVQLQQKWPENRTINIVCHGHSVPAGYFKTPDVRTFNAYPHLLHKRLKKQFPFAVINVFVTAIGGENSESGAKRFERDVFLLNPDVITIDYALNDRGVGLEKAKKAWTSMIELAKLKGIKIILLTPTTDKRAKLNDPNDQLNLHAEQIRDLAKKHQVGLVDSYASFKQYVQDGGDLNDLMSQVNHPNLKGHELVVKELLQWFPK